MAGTQKGKIIIIMNAVAGLICTDTFIKAQKKVQKS